MRNAVVDPSCIIFARVEIFSAGGFFPPQSSFLCAGFYAAWLRIWAYGLAVGGGGCGETWSRPACCDEPSLLPTPSNSTWRKNYSLCLSKLFSFRLSVPQFSLSLSLDTHTLSSHMHSNTSVLENHHSLSLFLHQYYYRRLLPKFFKIDTR